MTSKFAKKIFKGAAAYRAGTLPQYAQKQTAKVLFGKPISVHKNPAAPSISKVVQATNLGSYLDKHYEKKCGVEIKRQLQTGLTPGITQTLQSVIILPGTLAQGLTEYTRVGNKIEIDSIQFHATFFASASATGAQRLRVMLYKMGKNAGAVATNTQILQSVSDTRSFRQFPNTVTQSFKVIKDFQFTLSPPGATGTRDRYDWNYTYRPKGCHFVEWDDTTNGIAGLQANIVQGQFVFAVFYEDNTQSGTHPPSMLTDVYLQYVDL